MSRYYSLVTVIFFFFQAEDGIRDLTVTGVQTCALPISVAVTGVGLGGRGFLSFLALRCGGKPCAADALALGVAGLAVTGEPVQRPATEIGRASCWERV